MGKIEVLSASAIEQPALLFLGRAFFFLFLVDRELDNQEP